MANSPSRLQIELVSVSFLITAVFFGWIAFFGYFFSDDFTWLWHGKKLLENPGAIFSAHMSSFYSPVVNAYFTFLLPLFGPWAPGYYLVNLAVHILASALVGVFAWQLTRSRILALAACILATLAGSAYEPIVWIASNLHSIATLFILSACCSYLAYRKTGKIFFAGISSFSVALAFLTKEVAIVTPVLLVLSGVVHGRVAYRVASKRSHAIFATCIAAITLLYGYQEYLWQKEGFSVASGIWSPHLSALLRYPFALVQMIVPVERFVSASSAAWIGSAGSALWITTLIAGRKRPLILFGLSWIVVSLLPVIFFADSESPYLIASRYTYLARIGLILAFLGFIAPLLRGPIKNPKFVFSLVLVSALSASHLVFVYNRLTTEYAYVYQTGRTLVSALEEMKNYPDHILYVSRERPFDKNDAAIVGAASVVADISESRIVFLKKDEKKIPGKNETLLTWDYQKKLFTLGPK
ncbi:MAG: hypothetical protein AAB416_05215 [Patescibacteria group bacterium]